MSRPASASPFLNGANYQKLVGFLRHHYATKLGTSAIPESLDARIQKTTQHYMTEISRVHGPSGGAKPVDALNREVLRETSTSLDKWLKRADAPTAPSPITTVGAFPKPDEYSRLYEDTSSSYERLMAERAPPASAAPPSLPDFRSRAADPLESEEDPIVLMERLQKQREEQTRAMAAAAAPPRLEIKEEPAAAIAAAPSYVRPQAESAPPLLAPRPQDYIIPQEDVVKYLETEYNIFITSSDRDWLRNTAENRYNFSVNFNTGSKKTGFAFSPAIQERFRNIQRIEFVKAIVPIESLTTLVKVTGESPSISYDATRVINVFSLPFASVRIAELNNNGFSTKPEEDNTFAIVQYDTTWSSDLTAQAVTGTAPAPVLAKSGYTGLIPKFLKTQRVYTPTPLATLQRLTIRLERHSGDVLSDDSDVLSIARVCMSGNFSTIGTDSTVYSVNGASVENSYIFIKTAQYFPFSAVSEGDLLQIQGYAPAATSAAATDFAAFINHAGGHYVVATAYVNAAGAVVDGRNAAGYCNVIVLRSRFNDPKTGSTFRTAAYFGGSLAAENTLAALLDNTGSEPDQTGCALINFSRQTHFVLRIITRNMDSSANIRPDNV